MDFPAQNELHYFRVLSMRMKLFGFTTEIVGNVSKCERKRRMTYKSRLTRNLQHNAISNGGEEMDGISRSVKCGHFVLIHPFHL